MKVLPPWFFFYVFPFVVVCVTQADSQNGAKVDWDEVDRLVEEFRVINEIPGVALSFINGTSEGPWSKGYGLSDREMNRPMENTTRFLIASISKSFTAITTCRVLSRQFPELGESVLDTPIVELAPAFNLTLIDRYRTNHATFRDLLSHRMCLNSYGIGVTAGAYKNRADRLYRYRYIEEKCGFRSRFEYSNAMMILAGEIVTHISGSPFEDLVTELLTEIGMRDSLIVTPTEDYESLEGMSRGYYRNLTGQLSKMNASVYNSHSGAASGGVISTSADMARYILFHLGKGELDGQQIVPREVMEWTYKPSNLVAFSGDSFQGVIHGDFAYGLGLDLGFFGPHSRVGHIGDLSPFTSRLTFYPELALGIFTAINGPGPLPSTSDHLQLHNQLTQLVLGDGKISQGPLPKKMPILDPTHMTKTFSSSGQSMTKNLDQQSRQFLPEDLVGIYGHPYEGDVRILQRLDGGLDLQYGIWGQGSLLPTEEPNIYGIEWRGDIVSIFLAYSGGPPLPFIRWDFSTPDVVAYVDSDGRIEYHRNATIDTYPEIPWAPDSC